MKDIRAKRRRERMRREKLNALLDKKAEARRMGDTEQEDKLRKKIKKVIGPPPYHFVIV